MSARPHHPHHATQEKEDGAGHEPSTLLDPFFGNVKSAADLLLEDVALHCFPLEALNNLDGLKHLTCPITHTRNAGLAFIGQVPYPPTEIEHGKQGKWYTDQHDECQFYIGQRH